MSAMKWMAQNKPIVTKGMGELEQRGHHRFIESIVATLCAWFEYVFAHSIQYIQLKCFCTQISYSLYQNYSTNHIMKSVIIFEFLMLRFCKWLYFFSYFSFWTFSHRGIFRLSPLDADAQADDDDGITDSGRQQHRLPQQANDKLTIQNVHTFR